MVGLHQEGRGGKQRVQHLRVVAQTPLIARLRRQAGHGIAHQDGAYVRAEHAVAG